MFSRRWYNCSGPQCRPVAVRLDREGESAAAVDPSRRAALAMGAAAAGVALPGLLGVSSPAAAGPVPTGGAMAGDAALCRLAANGAPASFRRPMPIAQVAEGTAQARAADMIRVGQTGATGLPFVHKNGCCSQPLAGQSGFTVCAP